MSLPEIPSYRSITQFCTCEVRKETLLKVVSFDGMEELDQFSRETCPVNQIYTLIARQAGARVNPDK